MFDEIQIVDECTLQEAYDNLFASRKFDDLKLLKHYKKMIRQYSDMVRINPSYFEKMEELVNSYTTIRKDRLINKIVEGYRTDNNVELTIPSVDFFDDSIRHDFIGTKVTDFAKICGGGSIWHYDERLYNNDEIESAYWLKGKCWYEGHAISGNEIYDMSIPTEMRHQGIRPIIDFSNTDYQISNPGIHVRTYGEYPQMLASVTDSLELELLYRDNCLVSTGKTYTIDSNTFDYAESHEKINPVKLPEYYYDGKKYVRIEHNILNFLYQYKLSNNTMTYDSDAYWVEVMPLEWIIFPDLRMALSKNVIMSGIPYNICTMPKRNEFLEFFGAYNNELLMKEILDKECSILKNYDDIFRMTDMYMFMNKYMMNEISPSDVTKLLDKDKVIVK